MSSISVTKREAVPVAFGDYTLWCESFRAEETRAVSETASVDGKDLVTNSFPKLMKLTFSGRICNLTEPLGFILSVSDMLRSGQPLTVSYRGLSFTDCRIQHFKAEDRGEAFIYAELSVLSAGTEEDDT